MRYRGFTIAPASPTGGKAGKGNNKTSTIQVLEHFSDGSRIVKQIQFKMSDGESRKNAVKKAQEWVDNLIEQLRAAAKKLRRRTP